MTPYSAAALGSRSEPRQLAIGRPARLLGQDERVEPLPQLVHLGLLRVGLPELLLDRLQLLAEEELALALPELRLHLRLDLRAELEDLQLAVEDARDLAHPLAHVGELEDRLLLLRLQPQRRGDEVAERPGVVDVRGGDPQLLGQVGDEPGDPREQSLRVAGQRLQLPALLDHVRHLLELAHEVRLLHHGSREPDAMNALDEDPQRPVGNAEQLVDDRGRADRIEVVPERHLDVRVADGEQPEQAVAGDDVVDQPDRALLPDRERRHRVREDDRLLERQDRQLRGKLLDDGGQLLSAVAVEAGLAHRRSTSIGTDSPGCVRSAIGSSMRSIPLS